MEPLGADVEEAVLHAFLTQFAADGALGMQRTLAEYQARFPGHDEPIRREFEAICDGGTPTECERIGHYTVRHEIGRGGQAVVYLAHDPRLSRDVALKVLPRRHAAIDAESRLRREAAVTAQLDDTGICPIYEVGRDGEHLFLAMKYVEGRTLAARIATWRGEVDAGVPPTQALPAAALILEWFESLAHSLQRAHDAGIVHRDIKPANVMIGHGAPVLLDFGLAISVDDASDPLTRTGDVFGTPHYLSPERLTAGGHRGDARDDLWAFAVSLYEALTLRRPFQESTVELLFRSILDDDPIRPTALRHDLPRDLDFVLATALEKVPARRYSSAAEFAADLRAVRTGQPIRARPPNAARRLLAWHRRHPALATAAWLVLAGAGSTIGVQQASLREVRAARQEADDVNAFLIEKLLLAGTPEVARGETVSVAQVFDAAQQNVEQVFTEPSRASGSIQHVLGLANSRLGRAREARAAMERAVAIRGAVLGPDAQETLASRNKLVEYLRRTDDIAGAARELETLLPTLRRVLGPAHHEVFAARLQEAQLANATGRPRDAERLGRSVVADATATLGADDRLTIEASSVLAKMFEQNGQRAAAEPLFRDVAERRRRAAGPDSPGYVAALNDLASLLHDLAHRDGIVEKYAEAERVISTALAATARLHGESSTAYAVTLNTFASLLQERAQTTQDLVAAQRAVAMFRESLTIREVVDGPNSSAVATALGNLGGALHDVRELDEALDAMTRALRLREQLAGPNHPDSVRAAFNLMMLHDRRKDRAAAFAARADLEARMSAADGVDDKTRLVFRVGMVRVLWHFAKFEDAVREGREAYDACLVAWPGDGGPTARVAADLVASSYQYLGDAAAEALWRARATARN